MKDAKQDRYQGMTRKQYKSMKAKTCSESGRNKTILCQATGLDKAMVKYPRSIKTNPDDYFAVNLKKDLADPNHKESYFTRNR
jgi:hypothetical protein